MEEKYREMIEVVDNLKALNTKNIWKEAAGEMSRRHPEEVWTREKCRSYYRWKTSDAFASQRDRAIKKRDDVRLNRVSLKDRLLKLLDKRRSVSALTYMLKVDADIILAEAVKLQLGGYSGIKLWQEGEETLLQNFKQEPLRGEVDLSGLYAGEEIVIGIVSDTHIGSKFFDKEALDSFYAYAASKGVRDIYHIGDMTDGYYMNRPTSIFEQSAIGFQEQLAATVRDYPRVDGITTFFISGNHDATHMRNGGANIGEVLARYRDDMVYLGHNFARVHLAANTSLALIHPTDGSTKAVSYKLQEIIDRNMARRADIMVVGHYHKTLYLPYRGVHGFMASSFERQTPFMADNNLTSDVGGLILTIKLDRDGKIRSCVSEFVSYN